MGDENNESDTKEDDNNMVSLLQTGNNVERSYYDDHYSTSDDDDEDYVYGSSDEVEIGDIEFNPYISCNFDDICHHIVPDEKKVIGRCDVQIEADSCATGNSDNSLVSSRTRNISPLSAGMFIFSFAPALLCIPYVFSLSDSNIFLSYLIVFLYFSP